MNDSPTGITALVTHRPATDGDSEFLFALFSSTRSDELAAAGLDDGQHEALLRMQFEARRRSYELEFRGADDRIVLWDREPIGRMMTARADREIRLVDIALLPAHRGRGIGTYSVKFITETYLSGKASFSSREGEGTTFRIELDLTATVWRAC